MRTGQRLRAWWALLAVCALLALSGRARAQTIDVNAATQGPPPPTGVEQAEVARYWELGRPRPFFATTVEAGVLYLQSRFVGGYGRPFWQYVGVEAYPLVSLSNAGQYAGLVAALPAVSLRFGARYHASFSRRFVPPQERYSRLDLERNGGPRANYLSLEGELTGTFPLLNGSVFGVLSGYRLSLVKHGYYVFEDSLHQVVKPPYIWRARLGYLLSLSDSGFVRVGVTGELIGMPGRDVLVVRAGVLASLLISRSVDLQAMFVPVVAGADHLGLAGGDFGQLGIRYRWATNSTPLPLQQLAPARSE